MFANHNNNANALPREQRWLKYITYTLVVLLVYLVVSTLSFIIRSESTHGKITDVSKEWRCHTDRETRRTTCDWYYTPTFQFRDQTGKQYRVRENSGTSDQDEYRPGNMVRVLYKQNSPGEAKLREFFPLWGMELILSIVVMVFTTMHLYFQRKNRQGYGQDQKTPVIERYLLVVYVIPVLIIIAGILDSQWFGSMFR